MPALARKTQRTFGLAGTVGNYGQFGSKAAAAPLNSQDPAVIQALNAFVDEGFVDADAAGGVPYLEDMNGLFLVAFYQLAYLFEQGVPEWDAGTTYYSNGMCKYNGVLYLSLQNTNLNKNPASETAWWQDYIGSRGVQTGVVQPYVGDTAPSGYLLCQGQVVSQATYPALYTLCGTKFGSDGGGNFTLPDLRERVPAGYKSGSADFGSIGQTGGETTHTLTLSEIPSHFHGIDGNNISNTGGGARAFLSIGDNHVTQNTESVGGGVAHNNLPPYITLNYIVKT